MIHFIPPFSVLNESSGKMSLSSLIIRFLEENQVLVIQGKSINKGTKAYNTQLKSESDQVHVSKHTKYLVNSLY